MSLPIEFPWLARSVLIRPKIFDIYGIVNTLGIDDASEN